MPTRTASCCPQAYIRSDAPKGVRLKNRPREHFVFEHAFWAMASNRRQYIFPLFKLSSDGEQFLNELESSNVEYDRELLPADPDDLEQRFVDDISSGAFTGKLPGVWRSQMSSLHPEITVAENAMLFAIGALRRALLHCRDDAVVAMWLGAVSRRHVSHLLSLCCLVSVRHSLTPTWCLCVVTLCVPTLAYLRVCAPSLVADLTHLEYLARHNQQDLAGFGNDDVSDLQAHGMEVDYDSDSVEAEHDDDEREVAEDASMSLALEPERAAEGATEEGGGEEGEEGGEEHRSEAESVREGEGEEEAEEEEDQEGAEEAATEGGLGEAPPRSSPATIALPLPPPPPGLPWTKDVPGRPPLAHL